MSRAIPLVDLQKLKEGSEAEKKAFVSELGHAFQEFGFVGVINHGIPKELVSRYYAEAKAFFSLPTDIKSKYEVKGPRRTAGVYLLWQRACEAEQCR